MMPTPAVKFQHVSAHCVLLVHTWSPEALTLYICRAPPTPNRHTRATEGLHAPIYTHIIYLTQTYITSTVATRATQIVFFVLRKPPPTKHHMCFLGASLLSLRFNATAPLPQRQLPSDMVGDRHQRPSTLTTPPIHASWSSHS